MFEWIHWLPILADFEMKPYQFAVSISHLCYFLSFRYCLSFLHQKFAVMSISAKVGAVMLYDNKLTIATQSSAAVNYFTRGGSQNWLPCLT